MIDYHCHLLPAFDDGPAALDEALAMACALAEFGFRKVHCTPHCIAGHYEFSPVEVRTAVDRLQAELNGAGIPLRLQPGMEYALDDGFDRFAGNLLPLGETRLVLCEAPPRASLGEVAARLELIVVQGFVPLLAHPERSEVVWSYLEEQWRTADGGGGRGDAPAAAPAAHDLRPRPFWWRWLEPRPVAGEGLPATGAAGSHPAELAAATTDLPETTLYQANLGSFTGFYGDKPQRRAYELLQRNGYHCFASDLHDARSIPACLEPAREKLQFNPALQRLSSFVGPGGTGGSPQLAFW